jgi:hypothetical protein
LISWIQRSPFGIFSIEVADEVGVRRLDTDCRRLFAPKRHH